jgi:hypothetical protein
LGVVQSKVDLTMALINLV